MNPKTKGAYAPSRVNAHANKSTENQSVEQRVTVYKDKIRSLNPLRRARQTFTGTDGSNNPNFEGQDNGFNAWMDSQLNAEEIDEEMRYDVKYAKFNSEKNGCYDIDHIPIRGPPKIEELDSDISVGQVETIANELIEDDKILFAGPAVS